MPHIAPKYQGTQLPKHPTKNALAPNIQYKSCLQELKAVGFCSAMFKLKFGRMIPQGLCLRKAMKEHRAVFDFVHLKRTRSYCTWVVCSDMAPCTSPMTGRGVGIIT